jgi:hypothetical protein
MAEVQLLAPSREDAMRELIRSADQLARSQRLARPFLLAAVSMVVVVIPLWVLLRGADLIFLALAASAYALYGSAVAVLLRSGKDADRSRILEHWKALAEPFLCLPYGAHLFRKLSERYGLAAPLVDILRSDTSLTDADLHALTSHIREVKSMSTDATELTFLDELLYLIEGRLAVQQV